MGLGRSGVVIGVCALLALPACVSDRAETSGSTPTTAPLDPTEATSDESDSPVEQLKVEVVNEYPHDPEAFTQGLLLHEDRLYESTGNYGESTLREVVPETGEAVREHGLPPALSAEGRALVANRLIQPHGRDRLPIEYRLEDFETEGDFEYDTEGWGLCYDGERLVMSDGTDRLYFRDATTFETESTLDVTLGGDPLDFINELECVGGDIWANVWKTEQIVRIDSDSGEVTAVVDASGLLAEEQRVSADVLNGIAYDEEDESFLITGKWWPALFEVRFVFA